AISATAPLPTGEWKSRAGGTGIFFALAAVTMACAMGCSLPISTAAAKASNSSADKPATDSTAVTAGLPRVSVPVLSITTVSTAARRSSASAFLINTPLVAPRPTPTMMDMGVASPRAQGQAMINTLTAATKPCPMAGGGPNAAHATNVNKATASTAGTK